MSFSKDFAYKGNDIILCYLVGGLRHFAMWNKRPKWTDFLVKSRILSSTVGKCIDNQDVCHCSADGELLPQTGSTRNLYRRFSFYCICHFSRNRHPAKHRLQKTSMCAIKHVSKHGSFQAWTRKMATQSIRDTW